MKKICLLFTVMAMFFTALSASAQNVVVTGTIVDSSNGETIAGASVMVKDTRIGTSADADGKYSISVPAGSKDNAVVVFSFVGYKTQEVALNGKTVLNCKLQPDATVLEDVVVVGYGTAKKVGSLVGSVTTVKSEAIKNAPSSSALDQLQGQVAGMSVLTSGGVAGDNNVSIKIHGTGSLTSSSEPLYVIDGMQSSSRTIMSMNPNDILSISVLKDASATSIYGSRAANGVVYITTKAGSYDNKATVTIRSQAGISTIADMTLYKNMMSGPELKEFWVRAGIKSPEAIKSTFTDKGYDADTKWYNYYQRFNNPQYQNDVTVEGGGKKVAYMVGASQFHQRGTTIDNYFDRYTLRSNVQGRPKDWLKVGMNLSASYTKSQKNSNWGSVSGGNANYMMGGLSYVINPLYPAIDPETGKEYAETYPTQLYNSYYYAKMLVPRNDRYGFIGNATIELNPFKNFYIKSVAGIDGGFYLNDTKRYPSFVAAPGNGARTRSTQLMYTATITNTIEYSFDINNDHEISLLAGHEGIQNYSDFYSASVQGITDDRLMLMTQGKADTRSISQSFSESRFLSFFGHADYSMFGKYIFDLTVRNDASSRFGNQSRNALFWSVGGMWKLKKESFLRSVNAIDDLNIKVSYGTQGNASIGDYQHLALIGSTTQYANSSSMIIGQPSNPKLTWEKQGLFTVALTGRVFNVLDFDIEYYNRTTTSMLMDVPYPYTSGFSSLTANVGSLANNGLDVTLGVDILRGRDYFFRFNTTFNYNREKITKLFNGLNRWEIAKTGLAYVVGQPISYYSPIWAGVDPADGRQMWYVPGENKDVTTKNETTKKYAEADLTQNTGFKRHAPINGGFSLSGGWRGISMVADFSYLIGKYLMNNDAYFYSNPVKFSNDNLNKEVNDFWTPENTNAKFPDWSKGQEMQFDTHLIENASFLRLKNLQVAYNFPRRLLGKQNVVNGLKLSFTGRNLLTFTKYSGIDPEIDSNVTYGFVGNSKQYLFGLELTF